MVLVGSVIASFAVKFVNFQTRIFDGGAVYRISFCKMRKRLWRSQDKHLRPPSLFSLQMSWAKDIL